MDSYFSKLKVLEISSVLAGPLTGSFFSELGSKVIKVENLGKGGDVTRSWRQKTEPNDTIYSSYYASANYKKEVRDIDFGSEKGYAILIELIKDCDIIITNLKNRSLLKYNLDFHTIRSLNPSIIYAHLVAFSAENERLGYDMVMQAETGFLSMTGTKKSIAKIPIAMIDVIASHQLREGIMKVIIERLASNDQKARFISVSLYQAGISALINQGSSFLMNKVMPKPLGTEHPNIAPYGDVYETEDNKLIVLAIGSDQQFEKLVETLNLHTDEFINFMSNIKRVERRFDLNEILQGTIGKMQYVELTEALRRKRIPFGSIKKLDEVFGHPLALDMVRKESINGETLIGLKTICFKIYD